MTALHTSKFCFKSIRDESKGPTLLKSLRKASYQALRNLVCLALPAAKNYNELKKDLK